MRKRILSTLLALCMVLMLLPTEALADYAIMIPAKLETTKASTTVSDVSMDEINDLMPLATMVNSGSCGDNVTWALDSDGTLTISGFGNMDDYVFYTTIPWYSYRESIKNVQFQNGVTSIGNLAFEGCSRLAQANIPDSILTIGNYAFNNCAALNSVVVPNSVVSIGTGAFKDCIGLTDVTLPVNVDLGRECDEIFSGCAAINFVKITGTGDMADYTYSQVNTATYSATPWYVGSAAGNSMTVEIESGITTIGNNAFYGCSGLNTIKIPSSVISIGDNAFRECNSMVSISIPESVTSVGAGAFLNCNSLIQVSISGTINAGADAFANCKGLTGHISVSNTGEGAFRGCTSLTDVSIIDGTTSIGDLAFADCSNLTNITIPNSVTEIGWAAFSRCTNLSSVSIPNGVASIRNSTFYCSGLTSIIISDNISSIGDQAFSGCSALTSITMPAKIDVSVEDHTSGHIFKECIGVGYVKLTGTGPMVTYADCWYTPWYIGSATGNTVIIDIEDGVTTISEDAFIRCEGLKSIFIPASVTSIGNSAFSECSGLTDIYFGGRKEQWEAISVDLGNERLSEPDVTIHYTDASITDGPIRLLTEWDAENYRVRFNTDIIYYSITDETDLPAESLETLVGRYVLVDSDDDIYSVRSIRAVDSALGIVGDITASTITIDGKTYPLAADVPFPNAIVSREVLYHVLDGRVVSVGPLSWSAGILDNYNSLTGVITIDGEEHLTCFLTNLDAIDKYDLVGSKIGYALHDRIVIQLDPDPVDPDLPDVDEFEVSVYRANSLIHPPYSDMMTSLKGFSSPSRILVSEFSKNYWWLASTSVWSTFTNIMNTASKPSNLYKIATAKRDYYEALIFDLLEVSTNYGYVDYAKDLISEAKSWNGEIQNIIGVKESLEDIKKLTSDQKSLLEKAVKTKFIESYTTVHKDDIGEPTEGLAVINEVFTLSSSVLDMASSVEDYLEIMATSFALVRMEDSLKAVVRQMLASCPDNETALSDALKNIVKTMDATKEELFVQLMSKQVEIVGWNASKQLIDDFWSKGVLNCSPEVQALLKIYKAEKWLLSYVSGVDVDDIVEAGANVTNFVAFENLMLDVVSTLGGDFNTNKTTDTANAYLSAVDIMFATWLKSCSTAVSFEESLESEESFGAGMITHWIHLLNSNKGESADTLAAAVKNYEKNYILTYDRIWNGWIQKLNDDYPNSGLYEKYRELLIDFSNKYEATSFVRKKVEVRCPVDVFVYDKSNNLVASVIAGDAWYDASAKDITAVVEGDAKTLYLYDNASYRIECVGTDAGSMDVIVTEYDAGSDVRNVYFYDLPLTDGKTFEMSVDDKILSDADYELDSRGETLEPDLDTYAETSEQYTLIVVSGAVSSDDEAVFEGKYYAGELIEVTALIDANQTFTEWTSNSSSVTFTNRAATVTTFRMPAENVVVKAEISGRGYAIYLDGNGGTPESVVVATNLDGKLDTMPTATYTGHALTGWYTAKDSGEEVTTSTVFSEDATIYAHWTQNTTPPELKVFTITFNANGGTVEPASMTTSENGTLASLPTPIRFNHSFDGWYTATTGGTRITLDTVFDQDTTVYAQWTYDNSNTGDDDHYYPNASGSGNVGSNNGTSYSITTPSSVGGKISVSPQSAKKGDTVTITITPDNGYKLDDINVNDSKGTALELTDKGGGKYTFTMPDRAITVSAVFKLIEDQSATPTMPDWVNPFTDVAMSAWYYDAVKFVSENSLMNGISNNLFAPNENLSRAQLAQILYNKEGKPIVRVGSTFTDVVADAWYSDAVTWVAANNIVNGYGNGLFGPDDNITREQLAVMLWRYAGEPTGNIELSFIDADQIGDFAQVAICWAVENGILNGKGNNILDPKGFATRAEVAQMIKNYLG